MSRVTAGQQGSNLNQHRPKQSTLLPPVCQVVDNNTLRSNLAGPLVTSSTREGAPDPPSQRPNQGPQRGRCTTDKHEMHPPESRAKDHRAYWPGDESNRVLSNRHAAGGGDRQGLLEAPSPDDTVRRGHLHRGESGRGRKADQAHRLFARLG